MRAIACVAVAACSAGSGIGLVDGTLIKPVDVDITVERLIHAAEVTGAGIAIFEHGEPVYIRAYGLRDVAHALPLTPDSVMTAASLTKAAFAYLVMELVDTGQLDLDRPIREYLPSPLAANPHYADLAGDPRADRLTARMLLDHTSGLANWRSLEPDHRLAFHFEPGTRFAYSGEGIEILQLVVETIAHAPLEQLMQSHVFGPLGMTRTSMIWQPRFEGDHADGYDEYGRSLGPQRRTRATAAGGMQTTLSDYARLVSAVLRGTGLRPATRDQMIHSQIAIDSLHEFPTLSGETTTANQAIALGYGLGWGVYRTPYGNAFFKEGHDEGWRHYAVAFERGNGLLIMTNSSNGEGIYAELVATLLGNRYTPIAWEGFTPYDRLPPRPPLAKHTIVAVAPALLDAYAGRYGVRDIVETIARVDDHLTLVETTAGVEQSTQELWPETERDFFSKSTDDRFTFAVEADGRVTGLTVHADPDITIPRLP